MQILGYVIGFILFMIGAIEVGPTVMGSGNGAYATNILKETTAIKSTALMWLGSRSPDNTYTGVTAEAIATSIPDMALTDTGAASTLTSRSIAAVTYKLAAADSGKKIAITISGMDAEIEASVKAKLSRTTATVTDATADDGILVATFNG